MPPAAIPLRQHQLQGAAAHPAKGKLLARLGGRLRCRWHRRLLRWLLRLLQPAWRSCRGRYCCWVPLRLLRLRVLRPERCSRAGPESARQQQAGSGRCSGSAGGRQRKGGGGGRWVGVLPARDLLPAFHNFGHAKHLSIRIEALKGRAGELGQAGRECGGRAAVRDSHAVCHLWTRVGRQSSFVLNPAWRDLLPPARIAGPAHDQALYRVLPILLQCTDCARACSGVARTSHLRRGVSAAGLRALKRI